MNVPQESLDAWPRSCERLRGVMLEAQRCLRDGSTEEALELVEFAYIAVIILGNEMQQAGAARPPRLPVPPQTPQHLLSSEANWRYARALRQAYEAALAVDKERGWGTEGPAKILQMMLTDVENQVFGLRGHAER